MGLIFWRPPKSKTPFINGRVNPLPFFLSKMKPYKKAEMEYLKKFQKSGSTSIHLPKVNEIKISVGNTLEHELMKVKLAYNIMKEGRKFIMEATEIETGLRRDLIDISDEEIYEAETSPERAKRFLGQPVNIVPVGWSFKDKKWQEILKAHNQKKGL